MVALSQSRVSHVSSTILSIDSLRTKEVVIPAVALIILFNLKTSSLSDLWSALKFYNDSNNVW